MRRASVIGLLAGATALAALLLPAAAWAGTYTWSMPGDFTTSPPGSNPDHDSYGAKPWSYVEGPSDPLPVQVPSLTPASTSPLPTFSTNIAGGLSGWTDRTDTSAFAAVNTTRSTVGGVPAGQLALNPAADRVVAIAWTSPLPRSADLSITGSVTAEGLCPSWSLNRGTTPLQTGIGSRSISVSPTGVAPGTKISLVVGYAGLRAVYDRSCARLAVSLKITANQNLAPALTLSSPANGSLVTGGRPTFAGSAGTGFGSASRVTVQIYAGATAGGSPIETLTTTRGPGGGYSVGVSSPLANGRYTARAEQDDLGSPPDTAITTPHTFTIVHGPSAIGRAVTVSRKGRATASVTITCVAPASRTCAASVLILTVGRFQPVRSGPSGRLQVLFAYLTIRGGHSRVVRRALSSQVAHLLRRSPRLKVSVIATLNTGSGSPLRYSAVRTLSVGS